MKTPHSKSQKIRILWKGSIVSHSNQVIYPKHLQKLPEPLNGPSVWFSRIHNHGDNCWPDTCAENHHWHSPQAGKASKNGNCERIWMFSKGREKCGRKAAGMTTAWRRLSGRGQLKVWGSFTRSGLSLELLHQEPPHPDRSWTWSSNVIFLLSSCSWATNNVRSLLPGLKKKELVCCSVVKSPLFWWEQILHLIWKPRSQSLEEEWRGTQSKMLEVQCEGSSLCWFGEPCHLLVLVHCALLSPESTQPSTRTFKSTSCFLQQTSFVEMLI